MTDKELIRRALMGSREAQQACTDKGIALPCPFCGGDSELHEAEAIPECVKNKKEIPKDARLLRKVFYSSGSVCYEYRRKTVVPRCCKTNCAGRTTRQYRTKEEALVAWNTRPAPPVGRCGECVFSRGLTKDDQKEYFDIIIECNDVCMCNFLEQPELRWKDDFCSYFKSKED